MLIALLALLQETDADALLKQMEEKLAKAKTISVQFASDLSINGSSMGTWEGGFKAADANRVRISAKGKLMKELSYLLVCDGKKEKNVDLSRDATNAASAARRDASVAALSRFGIGTGLFLGFVKSGLGPHEEETAEAVKLSDAKTAGTEEVDGRKADVVTLKATLTRKAGLLKEVKDEVAQTIWIDAETRLPLKRAMSVKPAQGAERVLVETYSKWSLDAALEDADFKVP